MSEERTVAWPKADPAAPSLADQLRAAQGDSRYASGPRLGVGGMGVVQEVVDRTLERRLARKSVREELAGDDELTAMLVREARVTAQLAHPHVVPVHEVGVDESNRIYFTMKHVEGRTLKQIVKTRAADTPLEWSELLDLLDVVTKVCDALAYAHSRGVIHCDIKPANVMIGEFGEVYLMDWGVARSLSDEARRPDDDTEERTGTPHYMAPEQADGARLDVRVDVFAIGALLYYVVAGRAPYRGRAFEALARASLAEWQPVLEVASWVPPMLARIIERAMARDPRDRQASTAQIKDELLRFVRGGDLFEVESFAAGHVIIQEGEPGDVAYIIERGRCAVSMNGEWIRDMGPGEVFGEMAVLSQGPRTATVTTLEPTRVRTISGAALRDEIDAMKPWMASLVRTVADRARDRG